MDTRDMKARTFEVVRLFPTFVCKTQLGMSLPIGLESDSTFWRDCVRYEFTHKNPPPHVIQPLPDGVYSVHRSRQHLRGRSVHAEGDGPEPDPARRHLFGIRVFVRVHANSRRLAG